MLRTTLEKTIRDVPDFPKPGILFKDITPLLENPVLCADITDEFAKQLGDRKIDAIVGIESRGFLFGFLLAQKLSKPFILVRKAGKLPGKTIGFDYALEYGTARIEMQTDSIRKGWNVLLHDDLLATGGTMCAASELIRMQGGIVAGFAFVVELDFLNGKKRLAEFSENTISLIHY
jgi:adenine phosphoribosyltransferase